MWWNVMHIIQGKDGSDDYLSVTSIWQKGWWSFVFADVYLSFYNISDVVVCLTCRWICCVPNREVVENSKQQALIKLTNKPILSTICFPISKPISPCVYTFRLNLSPELDECKCTKTFGFSKIKVWIYKQNELVNWFYSDFVLWRLTFLCLYRV